MLIACPHCKHTYRIDDKLFGTIIVCSYCGKRFRSRMHVDATSSADQAKNAASRQTKKTPPELPSRQTEKASPKKPSRRGSKDISFKSSKSSQPKKTPKKTKPSRSKKSKKNEGCGCGIGCLVIIAIIAVILFSIYWFVFLPETQLPKHIHQLAKTRQEQIAGADNDIKKFHKAYLAFKETAGFPFFSPYAEKEKWEEKFPAAMKAIIAVQSEYDTQLKPVLKTNKKEDAGAVTKIMRDLVKQINEALALAKTPDERIKFIKKVQATAPEMVAKATTQLKSMNSLLSETNRLIVKATNDFPKRSDEIEKRTEPLREIQRLSANALQTANLELENHLGEKETDYALLGDDAVAVGTHLETFKTTKADVDRQLEDLSKSYSKVLTDMRIDYYVVVKRESWDNYYDYPTSHFYKYPPRKVSGDIYVGITKLNPEYTVRNGRWNINGKVFAVLPREQWTSGDDDAVYWVEEAYFKTYHKYALITDKEIVNTDWIEVDEDLFEAYYPDLGMEIIAKPFGYFEDEKLTQASPPGMAYVGNPRYGKWEKDPNTGKQFWMFAGAYVALNSLMAPAPHHRYYDNDWHLWNSHYRNKKPFYGGLETEKSEPIYGTGGSYVRTSGFYQSSNFARSGSLRQAATSIRSAGPGRRGRGPAGLGK